MKASRIILLALLAAVALLLCAPGSALAGGSDPETCFRIPPALQAVTQTSVGMMWETHNSDTGVIKLSVNSNMSGAITKNISSNIKRHEVRVTGLAANTLYYYTVKSDGETSAKGSFLTALPKGTRMPFRFMVYGDSREAPWYEDIVAKYGDNDDHLPCVVSMDYYAPDFLVHVGDFVYDGNDTDPIYNFFDVEKELLANNPLLATYGNHEFSGGSGSGNTLIDSWLIPAPGGTFDHYSVNYGNVHILVINTGEGVWASDNFDLLKPGSTQYNFIVSDLAAAKADAGIDHIFVSMHAPPYSAANFGDNQTLINALEPLFKTYGVRAIFMGHEHDYQHMVHDGLHYILSGGCGSPIMDFPWKGDQDDTHANLIKYDDVLNYVIVDVSGSTVNFQARKVAGNGSSSSSVIESFTLYK
ncbi:MAG: metallophosphoesterase family protein [Pseudomonadota bacterium]